MSHRKFKSYSDALQLFNTEYRKQNGYQLSSTTRMFLRDGGRIDVCHEYEHTMASITPDNTLTITLTHWTPHDGYRPSAHVQPWDFFGVKCARVGKGRYHTMMDNDPRATLVDLTGCSASEHVARMAAEKLGPVRLSVAWSNTYYIPWTSVAKWGYELMDGLQFNVVTGACLNPRRVVKSIAPADKARLRRDMTAANRTWRVLVRVDPTMPNNYPPSVPYAPIGFPLVMATLRGEPLSPGAVRSIKSMVPGRYVDSRREYDYSKTFATYVRQFRERLLREYGMTYVVETIEDAHGGVPA